MASPYQEKRRIQRIRLDCPISADLAGKSVELVDLSAGGACIEHSSPLKTGFVIELHFSYEDESIVTACTVVRCRVKKQASGQGILYRSGLLFNEPKSEEVAALRRIIAEYVTRDLEARRVHAKG